jgi:drug/metabolite transporter (DMT)-like permease
MQGSGDAGAWARLIVLGMVWGGSFIATAVALQGFGPFTVAAGRLALAALALTAVGLATGVPLPPLRGPEAGRVWRFAAVIAALSNALPFVLISWAQQHVPAGVAAVFMALLPLATLPLAHLFIPGDALTWRKAAGFAAGVAGGLTLIGPQAFAGFTGAGMALLAEIACLGVVLCYASGSIVTKRAPVSAPPLALAGAIQWLGLAMLAPLALWMEPLPTALPPLEPMLGLLWLGALSTGLAQVLLVQVLRRAGPSFLTQVNFMIPLWALAFGWALLGETPPPRALAALALILSGVALAHGLLGRRRAALTRRRAGG